MFYNKKLVIIMILGIVFTLYTVNLFNDFRGTYTSLINISNIILNYLKWWIKVLSNIYISIT